MPGEAVAAAAAPQPGQNGGQQQPRSTWMSAILRMAVMYFIMQYFRPQKPVTPGEGFTPAFQKGEPVDFYAYLSSSPMLDMQRDTLIWHEEALPLAAVAPEKEITYTYVPTEDVKNNGTVYLHAIFARAGASLDPHHEFYDGNALFGSSHRLTVYKPEPRKKNTVSLLNKSKEQAQQQEEAEEVVEEDEEIEFDRPWLNYWRPNLTVAIVDNFAAFPVNGLPPQLKDQMVIDPLTRRYMPTIFFNDFWVLRDYLIPVNTTTQELPLRLRLGHVSMWYWQGLSQVEQSFKMQADSGLMQDGESDEFKRVLLEGNPYLLGLTFVVSLLHSVFDMLAFKNDIGFWRQNKSMEGLSGRTIIINAFCQFIIFLYLMDNETSYVVLASSGIGTLIEFWKVTKAFDVSIDTSGRIPWIRLKDRGSYVKTKTKEYDEQAMVYLSYVLYPLVIGYCIYSLVYDKHKSWYSWIVSSLVGAVYMFGFILMCPQLYLNYKLKSVAHLPWRQMTYKFLNTIIDDLFAFVIKMPILHRLSVFRDDLIFLIYLYQRWIYPVDKKRVNEFGFAAENPEDEDGNDAAIAAAAAASAEDKKDGAPAAEVEEKETSAMATGSKVTDESGLRQRPAAQAAAGDAASLEDVE